MANPGASTFATWLQGEPPTASSLGRYLASLAEWWNSEFKLPAGGDEFGIRKSVCALSNARGGELFIGVSDRKELEGCTLTEQTVRQWLQQPRAQPGDWYLVDLNEAVRRLVAVPLDEEGVQVFVLEVVPTGRPAFVQDDRGELAMYVRKGES